MNEADIVSQRIFEMGRLMKRIAMQSGSLPLQCTETLRFINEEDEPSMHSLAEYLRIAAPSATSLIQSLVKDALVKRVEDKGDRRVVRLALTGKGKSALESAMMHRMKAMRSLIEPLSAGDKKDLARILSAIIANQTH